MPIIPYVTENTPNGERTQDIYSRLLKDRIIIIDGVIGEEVRARDVVAQLLFLESQKVDEISMYINSPGGSISEGLGIYDTMQHISSPVNTICYGMAASMGTFLLGAGTGKRIALPNAEIMIHQPLGGAKGQATEMEIALKHMLHTKKRMYTLQSKHWGRSYEEIEKASDRDNWMTAEQAKEFGIIDEVMTKDLFTK